MSDRSGRSPHQEGGDEQASAGDDRSAADTDSGTGRLCLARPPVPGGPYPVRVESHRFCMLCAAISR